VEEGSPLEVGVRADGEVHVVSVRGTLDLLTTVVFFNAVVELRSRPGTRLVLDLEGLTLLDSTGTGQIWKTVESVRREGGRVVLARVPPVARRTLDLVGISGEVPIHATVEEALKAVRA
jgi:anti-sigma B factor antagonist